MKPELSERPLFKRTGLASQRPSYNNEPNFDAPKAECIQAALSDLHESIEKLSAAVDSLSLTLVPVCKPPPTAEDGEATVPAENKSTVNQSVVAARRKVTAINDNVHKLLGMIDL